MLTATSELLTILAPDPGKFDGAACIGHRPDIWFPTSSDPVAWDLPRFICNGCPVKAACLVEALEDGRGEGMWGGLTPDERAGMQRQKRARNTPAPRALADTCRQGHPMSGENLRENTRADGTVQRTCRACEAQRKARNREAS